MSAGPGRNPASNTQRQTRPRLGRAAGRDQRDRFDERARPLPGRKVLMSTMWGTSPRWRSEVDFYVTERFGTLGDLRRLLQLARGKDGIILLGSVTRRHRYRDFVFAALLKVRPGPRPRVLVTDATWQPGSGWLTESTGLPTAWFALPTKLAVRLIDGPHMRYGVLSRQECASFAQTWGVDPDRVVFTPFPATIEPDTVTTRGDYLFAGGDSLRNYALLEAALTPDGPPARIAARWQPAVPWPNISAGPVGHEEFVQLLAGCRASVVPLVRGVRSAGQQSYLNAMALGKPVIVTEAPGVRDYIEHGVTGVIVPAETEALRAAIRHVMDPANDNHYARMGQRARDWVRANATATRYKDEVLLDAIGLPPR
ncbi:glycosyltransferase [Gephyromycinifex aptenodytis]|uniref:glycosyltransferase n=1 Tax=Gephyromycinifex aptenodytis TaxID=2716227 RepID=UPI0014459442|nr:glycosyltransferase [Gephyromycinifex aptenodytis]